MLGAHLGKEGLDKDARIFELEQELRRTKLALAELADERNMQVGDLRARVLALTALAQRPRESDRISELSTIENKASVRFTTS
jgi:hypothetical protein